MVVLLIGFEALKDLNLLERKFETNKLPRSRADEVLLETIFCLEAELRGIKPLEIKGYACPECSNIFVVFQD
ncbi:MAG: hypothetical protein JJE17_11750 [Peptostreptococcaceae bacterium]|nr:hypothetical protein [Peptostreptococcaceae bacterium]